MRRLIAASLALTGLLAVSSCSSDPSPQPAELVWHDEFDGPAGRAPNPTRWTPQTGFGIWGNDELECYTDSTSNVAQDGHGHLVITALHGTGDACGGTSAYTSARLTTRGHFDTTYGRLSMRARMPSGVGTWAAFWALGADFPTVNWPRSGEIDVVEHLGRLPTQVRGAVHGPRTDGSHWYLGRVGETGVDLSADFHEYAVDWAPDELTWLVDGDPVGHVSRRQAQAAGGVWVFDKPFFLIVNLAVGGTLGGPPGAVWPQHFVVDWIRVYSRQGASRSVTQASPSRR